MMTIIRVLERQYTSDGKPIIEIKKDLNGIPSRSTKFDEYYMDLSVEEEKKLREIGHFGFEAVRSFDLEKIKLEKEKLQKGERRKKQVLYGHKGKYVVIDPKKH